MHTEKRIADPVKPDQPREDGQPIGIRDVARIAGVSPATVSRVLNGSETVADDLRRRVFEAAERAGYRPNRLARNLRRQKADMIGVIVSDIDNPHFSEAVRVIEDEAFRSGYRLLLCNSDERADKQRAYLGMLADERVQGVILSPADSAGIGSNALLDLGIPVVAFDRVIDDPRADAVVCDNEEGLRRLTEHFIWHGHQRIAYVGGRSHVETGASRLAGYLAAVRAAGLVPFTVEGEFRADRAEAAVGELLARGMRPSAMVIANNVMAIGTLRALRSARLRVPDDVAIGSVDDPIWAELMDPPLTVLAQPVRALAQTAMRLMLERIEGGRREVRRVVLPMELRIRASSGGAVTGGATVADLPSAVADA
jgi:LacI family transcriptional regulator